MAKLITDNIRKMYPNKFIKPQDITDNPMILQIVNIVEKPGVWEGKEVKRVQYDFVDYQTGKPRTITSGSRQLWQLMVDLDPEDGEIFKISTYVNNENGYLDWKIERYEANQAQGV